MSERAFEDGFEFHQYCKHYKEIRLKKGSKSKVLKISGWMPELIAAVKHEAREEYKREIHQLLGIIS